MAKSSAFVCVLLSMLGLAACGGTEEDAPTPPSGPKPGREAPPPASGAAVNCGASRCAASLSTCGPACQSLFICIADCASDSCDQVCVDHADRSAFEAAQAVVGCFQNECPGAATFPERWGFGAYFSCAERTCAAEKAACDSTALEVAACLETCWHRRCYTECHEPANRSQFTAGFTLYTCRQGCR